MEEREIIVEPGSSAWPPPSAPALRGFLDAAAARLGFGYELAEIAGIALRLEQEGEEFAAAWLGEAEWPLFAALRVAKRRREWLAGRIVSKRILCRTTGDPGDYRRITVLNDAARAPFFPDHPELVLSISHSYDYAVAAVAPGPIGIDLEKIDHREEVLIRSFFTSAEQGYLNTLDGGSENRSAVVTELWARKEAVAKYLRRGGSLIFKQIDVLDELLHWPESAPTAIRLQSAIVDGYAAAVAC